jgi:hypothetical protein
MTNACAEQAFVVYPRSRLKPRLGYPPVNRRPPLRATAVNVTEKAAQQ